MRIDFPSPQSNPELYLGLIKSLWGDWPPRGLTANAFAQIIVDFLIENGIAIGNRDSQVRYWGLILSYWFPDVFGRQAQRRPGYKQLRDLLEAFNRFYRNKNTNTTVRASTMQNQSQLKRDRYRRFPFSLKGSRLFGESFFDSLDSLGDYLGASEEFDIQVLVEQDKGGKYNYALYYVHRSELKRVRFG